MTLIRWNPLRGGSSRGLVQMPEDVDRLFDRFLGGDVLRSDTAATYLPAVDVEETADAYLFKIDLPGIKQEDVRVSLMGDTMTIRGERKQETVSKDGNRHRTERTYGSFERSFELGKPVHAEQVQATYKDGVLDVRVPKAEQARRREVEIKVG